MHIQKATIKDTEKIVQVELQSGYTHPPNFNALKNTISLFKDKRERVFIAKEKEKVVGYISLREDKNYIGDIGFLAVLKTNHREGIASKLLDHVERYARQQNYKELVLVVRDTNQQAINLYQKRNFVIVGRRKSGDKIKLMMRKELE